MIYSIKAAASTQPVHPANPLIAGDTLAYGINELFSMNGYEPLLSSSLRSLLHKHKRTCMGLFVNLEHDDTLQV